MSPKKIAIFGHSGFAKEVKDICIDLGYKKVIYLSKEKVNKKNVIVESSASDLASNGFVFAMGVGDNKNRKKIYENFQELNFANLVHPDSTFGRGQESRISQKKGVIVTSGVRFTNNIEIGDFCIFNLNSTVGHDCVIADFVNVAPGCNISGNVSIGKEAYLGTNSCILQGESIENKMRIGEHSTVGAGAVVTKNVPPNTIVVGSPAKPLN